MNKHLFKSVSVHLLAAFCLIVTLFPLIFMLSTAFKESSEIFTRQPVLIPKNPTLANFRDLFQRIDLFSCFTNSLITAAGVSLLSLFLNSLAAYAFARLNFPGREKLFSLLLITMMIPGQVTMMPVFIILKNLGMLNSWWGLIIPGSASVFAIFMLRQFMYDIPEALLESARIDGCGEFRIYWSIMLPLCRPVLATLLIFNFLGAWNEFLWPLILMLDEKKYTLPVALANLNGQYNAEWGLLMAGAVLVTVPVILVFMAAQKHYVKGIAAGAVKG